MQLRSAIPPPPGRRTFGDSYGPIVVLLTLPNASIWAPRKANVL